MKSKRTATIQWLAMLLPLSLPPSAPFLHAVPGDPVNLWSNFAALNEVIFGAPAIGPTGTVVFGTRNEDTFNPSGNVYGFNPNGTVKWKFPFQASGPDWFESPPAIARDGTVYIGCWNNYLYAIDGASGNELWHFDATVSGPGSGLLLNGAITASPAIGPDGSIFIGSSNGLMFAIWPDGQERWRYQTDADLLSSILGGAVLNESGDTLYFGDDDGRLHAVDVATGNGQWTFAVPAEHDLSFRPGERGIVATPAMDPDGNVLFTCANGYIYMVSADGILKSGYATSDSILCSPVIDATGRIYICSRDTFLTCLEVGSEGIFQSVWETAIGDILYSTPALDDSGGLVLAAFTGGTTGSEATSVFCFDSDGQQRWSPIVIPTTNDASINISPDGNFYVGGYDGRVYKFEGNGPLAMAGWPRHSANRRQTGIGTDIYSIELIDFFPDIAQDFGNRSYVPWFGLGLIEELNLPDIEHIDHGKLAVIYSDSTGIMVWDYAVERWLAAYRDYPNYLYDFAGNKWLYHATGTSVADGRWFYDFAAQDWIQDP